MKKVYLKGSHDIPTFPDILLAIQFEGDSYEIPNGPRTYTVISKNEFLANGGELEIRNIDQTARVNAPLYT